MNIRIHKRSIIAWLLLLCLWVTLFSFPAKAESFTAEVTVASMMVRSGPSAKYELIDRLSKGTQVTVLSYKNGVALIRYDGKEGYALTKDMKKVSAPAATKAPESISGLGKVTRESKVYASASTGSSVLCRVLPGDTFTVLSTDGVWAKLQNGSRIGYIKMSDISITGGMTPTPKAESTPESTATPAPSPTPTGLAKIKEDKTKIYKSGSTASDVLCKCSKGETFTILSMTDSWVKLENGIHIGYVPKGAVTVIPGVTATPAVTASPSPTPAPAADNAIGTGTVCVNLLYIYSSASAGSSKLRSLSDGTKVTLYAEKDGWALVKYGTVTGYVKSEGLRIRLDADVTPTPSPTQIVKIAETMSVPAFINCSTRMYSKPSTSDKTYKSLNIGTEVTLLGTAGSWALVKSGSSKGYVSLTGVTKVSDATLKETMSATASVTASKVIVYKYASSSSTALGSMGKGTVVTVLACDDIWALVKLNGKTGYCTRSSLSGVSSPAINETESLPAVICAKTKLYAYATSGSDVLSTLSAGSEVTVLGHTSSWALVKYGSTKGYVAKDNVKLLQDVTLPESESYAATIKTAGTVSKYMFSGSPSAGSVTKGMSVTVAAHTSTWALIVRGNNRGYYPTAQLNIQFDEFASPTITTLTATCITSVPMYKTAQESGTKLGTIPIGTDVTVTAYTSKWARISYNSTTGYVLKKYLSSTNYTTLKSGSTASSDIMKLQKTLEDLGYFDGLPAGNYGSLTTSAVTRFQTEIGVSATGTADAVTLRVLYGGYAPESPIKSASLSKGSVGSNVTRLQTRLTYKGYLSAGIDGDFGNNTQSAVKLYQEKAGLNATGTADSATLKSLFCSSAPKNPGSPISGGSTSTGGTSTGGSASTGKYSVNPSDDPAPGTASDKIETVVNAALGQLGKKYVYGTSGPNTYDCSGLTCYCYRQIGVSLGRSAYAQGYGKGTKIETVGELKRGDIVCMNTLTDSDLSDHVGIYLGGGKMVHASSAAAKVIISSVSSGYYNRVFSWGRRIL